MVTHRRTFIEVVSSPRPEDGKEPLLPTYHELLEQICTRFKIPGSPSFWDALNHIEQRIVAAERLAKDMRDARDFWKAKADA
jgi:hypothetical protein